MNEKNGPPVLSLPCVYNVNIHTHIYMHVRCNLYMIVLIKCLLQISYVLVLFLFFLESEEILIGGVVQMAGGVF